MSKADEYTKSLPKSLDKKVDEAREMVVRQAKALDESKEAVEKWFAGKPLNRRDRTVLMSVVGLDEEAINRKQLDARDKDPDDPYTYETAKEAFFRTPTAFFYVDCGDDSKCKVIITAGKKLGETEVNVVSDSDPDFI